MPAPSYLLKSRHGVYYFRIRVAGFVRDLTHCLSPLKLGHYFFCR